MWPLTLEQQLLLDIVKGEEKERRYLENTDIDWSKLLCIINEHKLLPFIYPLLSNYIPEVHRDEWMETINQHRKKVNKLFTELGQLMKLASDKNINLTLHKGFVLSYLLYDDLYGRHIGDFDFLIREDQIDEVHQFLIGAGYFHACGKDEFWHIKHEDDYFQLNEPVLVNTDHHEYFGYYKKDASGDIELEIGRYLHQSIKKGVIDSFIEHTISLNLNGVLIRTFDLNHTFIALCEDAYYDSEDWNAGHPQLKTYLDLYTFISKFDKELSTNEILSLIERYNVITEVYTTLTYLITIFGNEVLNYELVKTVLNNGDNQYKLKFHWEIDFITRLFLGDIHRKKEIIKQNCFSTHNPNYINPLTVAEQPPPNTTYSYFPGNKTDTFNTHYHVTITREDVYFYVHLREHSDPIMYHLFFYDQSIDFEYGIQEAFKPNIFWEKGPADNTYSINDPGHYADFKFVGKHIVIIKIPRAVLPVTDDNKLCYGVSVAVKKLGFIVHWMTDNPFDTAYWTKPSILQLPEKANSMEDRAK